MLQNNDEERNRLHREAKGGEIRNTVVTHGQTSDILTYYSNSDKESFLLLLL